MSTDATGPEQLLVPQAEFAGPRFWAAADRLAHRRGHGDHQCGLIGLVEPTDRYELRCVPCDEVLAVLTVERTEPGTGF
jgi:hypothetical protein